MSEMNSPERKGIPDPGESRPRETRQADPRLAKALGALSLQKAQRREEMQRRLGGMTLRTEGVAGPLGDRGTRSDGLER